MYNSDKSPPPKKQTEKRKQKMENKKNIKEDKR